MSETYSYNKKTATLVYRSAFAGHLREFHSEQAPTRPQVFLPASADRVTYLSFHPTDLIKSTYFDAVWLRNTLSGFFNFHYYYYYYCFFESSSFTSERRHQ